jgi:threonine dehydrogenase-like Zn-dependent dehydrogenase
MRAVVFHAIGDIRLDNVREPKIEDPLDAIVQLTASAICGTDLHMVRGAMPRMAPGTILGHEGVGIIQEFGKGVNSLRPGDRVA